MKNSILVIIIFFPFLIMAQKGIIKPETKPSSANSSTIKKDKTVFPDDIKLWTLEENLVNCLDSVTMCYVVKENGVRKTIPQDDLYEFIYEEGYRYTIWVKEEIKTPPISASSGIYNYILVKIVSKKLIEKSKSTSSSYTEIPTVNNETKPSEETSVNEKPETKSKVFITSANLIPNYKEPVLRDEIESLKKQIKDLKKQVELMQIQIEMQLQLILKK